MLRPFKSLKTLGFWQVVMAFFVMVGTAGGVYGLNLKLNSSKEATPTVTTQLFTVRYGDISQTLTVSGYLSYYETEQLAFGANGTIKQVNVTAGDSVAKGDILAEFDDASIRALQKQYLQAQESLSEAQANLAYTDTEIAQAQLEVVNAQIALETAEDNLEKAQNPYSDAEIAQAKLAVINAQIALETAEDNLYKAEYPYTDEEIAAAEQAVKDAEQDLSNAYTKAGLDYAEATAAVNDAYADYLAAISSYPPGDSRITKAELAYERAKLNLQVVQDNITDTLKAAEEKVQAAKDALADMLVLPDPLNIQQKQGLLVVAQNNLSQATVELSNILAGANSLDVQQKQQLLIIAQNNLSQATANLAEILDASENINAKLKQIEVDDALAALDEAKKQLESTSLAAPFSGIVNTVNIKTGQAVTTSTVAIEMVDPSILALSASVNELDISQVKIGQSASISVDALSDQQFDGKVSYIATTATTSSGVVSYKVTVLVTASSDTTLKSGMSAIAEITTQQASNVLVVPNKAIGGTTNNPTVTVIADGQVQTVSIKTGLSDDSYTEVTQGLQAGDTIQIGGATKTSSTSTKTTTIAFNTQFPGGGMMPGGEMPSGGMPGG